MARTPIKSSELLTDRPLEWDVYDLDGALLFAKGSLIDAEAKSRLLTRGALRDVDDGIGRLLAGLGKLESSARAGEQARSVRILLNDTAVRPGDTVHLTRSMDGSRIVARFIGYLKDKSVIITVPADEQGAVFLKEGESVAAKVFSGKHVLIFSATVLAVVLKPYPHIHLNFPAEVTGIVVRNAERATVRLVAAIEMVEEQISGIITDISTGGLAFSARSNDIVPGSRVTLSFKLTLAGNIYYMKLKGLVRTIRPNQSEVLAGANAFGVQFQELSAEDTLIIGLFVSQQIAVSNSAGK